MSDFDTRRTIMVDTQVRPSDVTKFPIIEAMLTIPRERYVPDLWREAAYAGENVPLTPGRVVLEPRTLAKMLEAADIQPSDLVLDIGCGLGYSAAVAAMLAEAVVALEEDEGLAREAETTLAAEGIDNAVVFPGTLADGAAQHGPYDVVLIEGGVERLPEAIADQMNEGARIVCIFMEGALGAVRLGRKIDGVINWRFSFNAGAPVLPGFEKQRTFSL